ncbi:hypothetical protein, partial [Salmonella enterica]|uniref:hypothetical protein n=1 Tax=Salmonella enterica TaxID=28901 RepID=UPI0032B620E7
QVGPGRFDIRTQWRDKAQTGYNDAAHRILQLTRCAQNSPHQSKTAPRPFKPTGREAAQFMMTGRDRPDQGGPASALMLVDIIDRVLDRADLF